MSLWDLKDRKVVRRFDCGSSTPSVNAVAFNEGESHIAAGTALGEVRLFQISAGKLMSTYSTPSASASVTKLEYSKLRHDLLAVADSTGSVQVWNIATSSVHSSMTGHRAKVNSISFSPVNKYLLATASDDQKLHFCDVDESNK